MNLGKLICVGLRGDAAGEAVFEKDIAACCQAQVGGVILFDVDVPHMKRLLAAGVEPEAAREQAVRNVVDAEQLHRLTASIRQQLGAEVMISLDQEGGSVARLSPRRGFAAEPSAQEFAEMNAAERLSAATHQARQLAELGFDLNYAPCVDLALEAENEIITKLGRSFGDKADVVVRCATDVIEAHLAAGVAPCLKHFPGHGSSRGDSHLGMVDITDTWQREEELAPFRQLGQLPGVAIMVAHVIHRTLGGGQPASLTPEFIDGLLRGELGFDGVVITDSIDMRAIAAEFSPGEAAVAAVAAGADIVVDGFNLSERAEHPAPELVAALDQALQGGFVPGGADRLAQSVRRIDRLRQEVRGSA
ncbi:MAG: beta-N-acetylhexosaminidase [Candidatus Krumholzibacteriia bacterium]